MLSSYGKRDQVHYKPALSTDIVTLAGAVIMTPASDDIGQANELIRDGLVRLLPRALKEEGLAISDWTSIQAVSFD